MLNTRKLLYILPDVAYVAELLPGKKEHTFTIQAFRQINGEFINEEEELIPDNIDKLFGKIEPEAYHLVLPDFLFTNTILEIKDTNEGKVKTEIKDVLLPKLEITKETHEIETFSLTTYNGATKVQLTALEKTVLDPLVVSANAHKVTVEHISPLTWTIKAVISLEPSISVLQIGSMLYVAEHYIGVDQCSFSKVDELENVVEAIKTLKGSQPSIQTVYLLTNQLVEEKLKEQVSNTLPIQQLASFKDADEQMPSYVKQIIESGMKTLDIPDFPVPSFTLPKTPQGDVKAVTSKSSDDEIEEVEAPVLVPPVAPAAAAVAEADTKSEAKDDADTKKEETPKTDEVKPELAVADSAKDETPLPTPITPADGPAKAAAAITPAIVLPTTVGAMAATAATVPPAVGAIAPAVTPATSPSTPTPITPEAPKAPEAFKPIVPGASASITPPASTSSDSEPKTAVPESSGSSVKDDDTTIATLAGHPAPVSGISTAPEATTTAPEARPVIKNKGGGNLMKMAFVSLTAFALTVAIVIGIGYAVMTYNKQSESEPSPSPVVSSSPMPTAMPAATQSATPSASASASIDKKSYKILVVNATTTPGYAGTTSTKLKADGYAQVTAKNALGDYEPGFYLLLATEDPGIVQTLSDVTDLDLSFKTGKTTEDPSNQYDAVIVLGE